MYSRAGFIGSVFLLLVILPAMAQQSSTPAAPSNSTSLPVHQETIIVTGTYQPIPLRESDRSVDVISFDDDRPLYGNWVDGLRLDPSVDVRQRASGLQADLSIRGSSFQQTLVLVDGLRVNDAQSSHHNLDLPIPFTSMERIEVLHGSGSTMYGSDAVGGTVNFITAAPSSTELTLGAAAGNFGSNQQYGSASYSNRMFSGRLSVDRDFSSGFMEDRDYRNLGIASESHLATRLGTTAILVGITDRPFGANQFYGDFNSWERTKGWFVGAAQGIGSTQLAFGYRRHTDEFVLFRDQPSIYENNHITESYQLALRRHEQLSSKVVLFYGAEAYRDTIDSNNLGYHGRKQVAIYVDVKAADIKRFILSVGARGEIYSGDHSQFSPSFALGYRASHKIKLKASVSHAFRLPTYTDLYYQDPANIGNPNLKPERAWGAEAGVLWNMASRTSTELTVFSRWERDGIDYVRANPQSLWQAANIDRLNFTGVEIATRFAVGQLHGCRIGYTGIYGVQNSSGTLMSKYVRNYPSHQATAAWLGVLPGKLDVSTRLGVIDRYAEGSYLLAEVAVRKSFGIVSPFMRLTNITNTGYEEIEGVRMPGRTVLAGLELHLGRENSRK